MGSHSYKWKPEEEHLLRLLLPTNSFREIAEEFARRREAGIPGFRAFRSVEAIRKKCVRDGITSESALRYIHGESPYQKTWNAIQKIQKQYRDQSISRDTGLLLEEEVSRKILSLSDIHFPVARLDLLDAAISDHADADIVVLNGDILDADIFSTFDNHKRIAAVDEYNVAFDFIRTLSENFPKVILVDGNHEARVSKALKRAGLIKEQTQILRPNLLARMANGERLDSTGMLVEKLDFSNVLYQSRESWYVRIGKTIFAHPSARGSSKPGHTVNKVADLLGQRYTHNECDCVVAGHTHKIYKGVVNGRLLIEQGCLADLLPYAFNPGMHFMHNALNGYAVIYQDKYGNTDFNRSGPIYMGEVLPPKKSVL